MIAPGLTEFVVFTNSERGMPVAKAVVQARLPGEHGALKFEMVG